MASIRQALLGQPRAKTEKPVRILLPIAGDDLDAHLLNYVCRIARKQYSFITMIYVVEVDQALPLDMDLPTEVTRGEGVLQRAQGAVIQDLDVKSCAITTDLLQARLAGPAIVDEAVMLEADAIIMSARVSKRFGKRTLGDTVDYVLKNAPCEVLLLRAAMPKNLMHELEMDLE